MLTNNVIKQNNFHVEEDFYEEIINGLQAERDRELERNKKQPIVILPRQARYIKYVTAPLMAKQGNMLIEQVSRYHYKQQKIKKINGLRQHFLNSFVKFAELSSEVNKQIVSFNDKAFNILNVYKTIRRFKQVARLYHAIKMYKCDENPKFEVDLDRITNPVYFSELETYINELLFAQQRALQGVFAGILIPIAKELFAMYDEKLEELYIGFWKFLFRNFIFDPESALDWVVLIVSLVAGAFSFGTATGAIGGGAIALKITTGGAKIFKALKRTAALLDGIKKIPGVTGLTKVIAKTGDKVGTKMAADLTKKLSKAPTLRASVEQGWRTYTNTRNFGAGISGIASIFDFVDVTDEDVDDYYNYISRRTRIWGDKFEAKVSDDLSKMITMSADVIQFTSDVVTNGISKIFAEKAKKKYNSNKIDEILSRKFKREVSSHGFYDLKVVQIIDLLAMKFKLLWETILTTSINGEKIFEMSFIDYKSIDEKIKISDSNVVELPAEKISFGLEMQTTETGEKIMKYFTSNGVTKFFMSNAKDNKVKEKVNRRSFKKIFHRGFLVGFEVQFSDPKMLEGETIIRTKGGQLTKSSLLKHPNGLVQFIAFNVFDDAKDKNWYTKLADLLGEVNENSTEITIDNKKVNQSNYGLIKSNQVILEKEKETQFYIEQINDCILKAIGGIGGKQEEIKVKSFLEFAKDAKTRKERKDEEIRQINANDKLMIRTGRL